MNIKKGNLFEGMPGRVPEEVFAALVETAELKLERIVSQGQATPPGKWLAQARGEWVILLRGHGRLGFEEDNEIVDLLPGDFVRIPAGCRHRVAWTDPRKHTVWLALHYAVNEVTAKGARSSGR